MKLLIEPLWGSFAQKVGLKDMPAKVTREMRTAFFAGAFIMMNVAEEPGISPEEAEKLSPKNLFKLVTDILVPYWVEYRDKLYPGGIIQSQEDWCSTAFINGAINILSLDIHKPAVEQAVNDEITSAMHETIYLLKSKN